MPNFNATARLLSYSVRVGVVVGLVVSAVLKPSRVSMFATRITSMRNKTPSKFWACYLLRHHTESSGYIQWKLILQTINIIIKCWRSGLFLENRKKNCVQTALKCGMKYVDYFLGDNGLMIFFSRTSSVV